MKALKTIVATAVIVFTLTTVAMAGVDHFTTQNGQDVRAQAQTAPATTITLTAAQFAQLMRTRSGADKAKAHLQTERVQHQSQASCQQGDQNGAGQTGSTQHAVQGGADDSRQGDSGGYDHHDDDHADAGSGNGDHAGGDGHDGGCW